MRQSNGSRAVADQHSMAALPGWSKRYDLRGLSCEGHEPWTMSLKRREVRRALTKTRPRLAIHGDRQCDPKSSKGRCSGAGSLVYDKPLI
jgi:hypothetical protein